MTTKGIKRRLAFFLVNKIFCGVQPNYWEIKRCLLNWAGINIGNGSKIVGPIRISGDLNVGSNTWIGAGLTIHGNGLVVIGSDCDIAPDVTFLTGSHEIGYNERRAGRGLCFNIKVNDGSWIGALSTLMGNIEIGKGCVIGACSLVNKSCPDNIIIGGNPAKTIKELT